ncbi:MAG: potassium channel protein [Anaerolineae bacterium]
MALRTIEQYTNRFRVALSYPLRRMQLSLFLLAILLVAGTLGYVLLEGMTLAESLYMTVITISTVGFGEVRPLSQGGRLFTIILILLGVLGVTGAVGNAVEVLLGERVWHSVQKRRMEKWLMTAKDHYVICGYGRIGQQIARDLQARGQAFVVIDQNPENEEHFLEEQINFIIGNATQDEVLIEAGIERARGLVAALDTDADNVLAVLTARELNPGLFIVARAETLASEKKLRRAGANRVVSPYDIGGHRLSLALLRPAVHDLLNRLFDVTNEEAELGEIHVGANSRLKGQTISRCDLRQITSVTILAIQKPSGEFRINPSPQYQITEGDVLVVVGPPESIYQLEQTHETPTPD